MDEKLYGAIEFGGTKTICAIGKTGGTLQTQTTIPTTGVEETLGAIYKFFENKPIHGLGVGAFGPLDLNNSSPAYGSIRNTPKAGWENVKIKSLLEDHLKVPVAIDLDVNTAALGELHFGVAQGVNSFVYVTLGTGIGGSLIVNGQPVHGIHNLEMGHMRIPHEPFNDGFEGVCTYHKDCLEGIASGYAMEQRYGQKAESLTGAKIWDTEASYIAAGLHNIMLTVGPDKIILGGGLIKHPGLIENIREKVVENMKGYLELPDLTSYIVRSSGDHNGVLGAITLASHSLK